MRIFKYTLNVEDEQWVSLPVGARILSAQVQHGRICLWALVDPEQPIVADRQIGIYGTGNPLPEHITDATFISTVQLFDGKLIFHVFELTKPRR